MLIVHLIINTTLHHTYHQQLSLQYSSNVMARRRQRQQEWDLEQLHQRDPYQDLVQILQEGFFESQIDVPFDILRTTIDRLVVQQQENETWQMLDALLHLSRVPLFSNDDALVAALTAMEAVQDDVAVPNETRYYIRSMEFTREEFQQAIQQYRNDYAADTLFADHLINLLQEHPTELLVFVRYVGATGDDTPLGRLQHDLDVAHQGGRRFSNFTMTIRQLFPHMVQVYHIPLLATAGVFGQPGPQSAELDAIERILIHLLDRQCLINSQPGGFYISYTSNENDLNLLAQVNAPNALAYLVAPDNIENIRHVDQQLLDSFQAYRTELAGVDQVMADRITNDHLELFAHQALPHANRFHQVNEETAIVPFMIVGKDNTIQDFSLQRGFFEGSRSGTITGDLMRMALNGMQGQPLENHLDLQLQIPCFGDLWPIPKQDYFWELHTQSLSRMLAYINPAVMMTCGFDVARVAISNFHDRYGVYANKCYLISNIVL